MDRGIRFSDALFLLASSFWNRITTVSAFYSIKLIEKWRRGEEGDNALTNGKL